VNPYGYPSIPAERRATYLHLMHDNPRVAPILFHLQEHFPRRELDKALSYLKSNRLTGDRLEKFYLQNCGGSLLALQRTLLNRIKKERVHTPLIFGREFV